AVRGDDLGSADTALKRLVSSVMERVDSLA
ncbi:MAG: hypothetical protein JWR03_895, partial [Cohnella sp.]|nr:hypothetical protein [Cohnella sp.]